MIKSRKLGKILLISAVFAATFYSFFLHFSYQNLEKKYLLQTSINRLKFIAEKGQIDIYLAKGRLGESEVEAYFQSLDNLHLGDGNISFKSKGKNKAGLISLRRFEMLQGDQIYPGLYSLQLRLSNGEIVFDQEVILKSVDWKEFLGQLSDKQWTNKLQDFQFLQELIQKYGTAELLTLEVIKILESLKKDEAKSNLLEYFQKLEAMYYQSVGSMLTHLLDFPPTSSPTSKEEDEKLKAQFIGDIKKLGLSFVTFIGKAKKHPESLKVEKKTYKKQLRELYREYKDLRSRIQEVYLERLGS